MEETKTDEQVITPPTEEIKDDKGGEIEKKEDEGKEEEEITFDENDIDEEVKNYKKPELTKEEEEDDIDAEDKARIEKVVEKKYGTTLNDIQKKAEFDSFFNNNPELTKYRTSVELYKNHPAYSQVPIKNIAAMLSSKEQQKIGAAKERAAQKTVEETKSPGDTARKPSGESVDWLSASKAEYDAKKAEVLGRPN